MTWIDWAIVIVLAASIIGGISQGILRSVCSLCGLIFGLLVAAWNFGRIAAILMPIVRVEEVADAIGFLLIALLIMAIANVLGAVLSKTVQKMGLGCLDRLAGGVFGLIQGVVLVTLALLVIVAFFPKSDWFNDARLPRQFFGALHLSTHMTPGGLADRVRHGLVTMEQRAPEWMHPPAH